MSRLGRHSAAVALVVLAFYLLIVDVVCHVCSNLYRIDCLACLTSVDFAIVVLEHVAVEVVVAVVRLDDNLKTTMRTTKTDFLKLSFVFENCHSHSCYSTK